MLKILRKKIQSLSQTQQNLITLILILFNIGIIIFWINFWLGLKKTPPPKITEKPKQEEISEPYKPGEIGEIPEEKIEKEKISPLPQIIFDTTGVISQVKSDRLIVQGSGSNFADQKQRELTIIFTNSTITFEKGQKVEYQGLDGLAHLKEGMEILIQGEENIRGKTEFKARTINIL
jgi:hypothetical protein